MARKSSRIPGDRELEECFSMEATGGSVSLAASGIDGRKAERAALGHRELVALIVVTVPDGLNHDRWAMAVFVHMISMAQEIALWFGRFEGRSRLENR